MNLPLSGDCFIEEYFVSSLRGGCHLVGADNFTAKHCILDAQGLLMWMGSKFLMKMIRLQKIEIKEQCFVAWSSYQNL